MASVKPSWALLPLRRVLIFPVQHGAMAQGLAE